MMSFKDADIVAEQEYVDQFALTQTDMSLDNLDFNMKPLPSLNKIFKLGTLNESNYLEEINN
jgi:hypothetical protein